MVMRLTVIDEKKHRLQSPYTRMAVEWILVVLFAGIVAAILGVAAAIVYLAWA